LSLPVIGGFKGAAKVKNNKSPVTFNLVRRHIIKPSAQSNFTILN
jgi:hypothetical protein